MYSKKSVINIGGSASCLNNNLSVMCDPNQDLISFLVTHKSTVHVATDMSGKTSQREVMTKEQQKAMGFAPVLHARFISISSRKLLAASSTKCLQLFDADDGTMLFWHKYGDEGFGKAICAYQDSLCVGTSKGRVMAFRIPTAGLEITLRQSIAVDTGPICSMASDSQHIYAGLDNGVVALLTASDEIAVVNKTTPTGSPIVAIAAWNGCFVAGFSDGIIRVFRSDNSQLCAEVYAHARVINAMDISASGLLLTASEDTTIRLWQLRENVDNDFEIDFVWQEMAEDKLLVGVQFTGPKGDGFAFSSFDSNEITVFSK